MLKSAIAASAMLAMAGVGLAQAQNYASPGQVTHRNNNNQESNNRGNNDQGNNNRGNNRGNNGWASNDRGNNNRGNNDRGNNGNYDHRDKIAAPEIDPASAITALTLLAGGLAVIRGRRSI